VREVERIARKIATEKVRKKHWSDGDPGLQAIEREFTETLGTRVQILRTEYGGRMTIDYFSEEDLRKILETIHRGESINPETKSEKEMLTVLAGATPLTQVPPSTDSVIETDLVPTTPNTSPIVDEEVFTKHDTIEEPETPVAVLDQEIKNEEVEDEDLYSIKNFNL
jgi:hypothetical protein